MSTGEYPSDSIHDDNARSICERVLGGVVWRMVYQGAGKELNVLSPVPVKLPVWRYKQHRKALQYSLQATANGVQLDTQRLVRFVLGQTLTSEQLRQLTPLILWWISGGDGLTIEQQGKRLIMDTLTITLQPWSEQQRVAALQACLVRDPLAPSADSRLDPISYLYAMVKATAYKLSAQTLDELDAAQTQALCQAVTQLNMPAINEATKPMEANIPPVLAARTLRLCKALGWTPEKVWSTPAVEIDRLLALLDKTERKPVVTTPFPSNRKKRLADAPDAIVIHIENDE